MTEKDMISYYRDGYFEEYDRSYSLNFNHLNHHDIWSYNLQKY